MSRSQSIHLDGLEAVHDFDLFVQERLLNAEFLLPVWVLSRSAFLRMGEVYSGFLDSPLELDPIYLGGIPRV
jgi:hypothetical protein